MIAHISFSVIDFDESLKFYDEILKTLGYQRVMTFDDVAGYGKNNMPYFWISTQGNKEEFIGKARGVHCAFNAPSKKAVEQWWQKAQELGGTDNGKPGLRPEYYAGYYAAYIIDPDGWRIEAVYHTT